tara:strand:+ start:444 stop:614 length:171 start_codon:yes stop_codon:yes gene_type:complete
MDIPYPKKQIKLGNLNVKFRNYLFLKMAQFWGYNVSGGLDSLIFNDLIRAKWVVPF